jgi:hypothetical protein
MCDSKNAVSVSCAKRLSQKHADDADWTDLRRFFINLNEINIDCQIIENLRSSIKSASSACQMNPLARACSPFRKRKPNLDNSTSAEQ